MPQEGTRAARTLALLNQKGGVGKTTTAVNLIAAFARAGVRPLLVDLDPQAHATLHLGVDPADPARSVYDLLLTPLDRPEAALLATRGGIHLIPSETDLAAADLELAEAPDRNRRLADAFNALDARGGFDVILIDCPPSLGVLTLNALAAADSVLIPMQAHFLALQGVGKLLETVRLVASGLNPRLRVEGVVLCMHDSNTTHAQEVVADLDAFFAQARAENLPWSGACVLHPPIRRNIKLAECPSFGSTIFEYAPTAAGAADYAVLARALMGRMGLSPDSRVAQRASPFPEVVATPAAHPDAIRSAGAST